MSSAPERDMIDYVDDNSQDEDETPFIPVPESTRWPLFGGGILIAFAGGALAGVAPWLAGLLIAAGYGMTVFALIASSHRFARALRFGFVLTAMLGAAIAAGGIFAPAATAQITGMLAERGHLFAAVVTMPLVIGLLKYIYAPLRRV